MDIPRVIAHRGASAFAPENTMEAFRLAERLGATMFECDVQLTADGVPIIFHDESLRRMTNLRGNVADTPWSMIQALTFKIPTLSLLLDWLETTSIQMNLELKCAPAPVTALLQLRPQSLQDRILLSSFNFHSLQAARFTLPKMKIALLIDRDNFKTFGIVGISHLFNELKAFSIHCDKRLLSPKNIAAFQVISPNLLAFTVNNRTEAERLYEQGVMGVFSDNPRL